MGRGPLSTVRTLVVALCIAAGCSTVYAQKTASNGGGVAGTGSSAPSSQVVSTQGPAQAAPVDETGLVLDQATPSERAKANPSSLWSILRTILALVFVAAAVYGVVFILKRIARPNVAKDPHLKVLASAHLGSNRYVHVVSLGRKAWVVGSAEGTVNLIAEVEDEEEIDAMLLEDSRRLAESPGAFSLDFKELMRRLGGGSGGPGPGGPSADSIRKKRERLRGM